MKKILITLCATIPFLTSGCNSGNSNNVTTPVKYMFVSQSSPSGNMIVSNANWQTNTDNNPTESADIICQHDAESIGWIPATKGANNLTWKALIVNQNNRVPSQQPGWVLQANTQYIDIKSNVVYGTTNNQAIFNWEMNGLFGTGSGYDWSNYDNVLIIKSGIDKISPAMGTYGWFVGENCKNWTITDNSEFYWAGIPIIGDAKRDVSMYVNLSVETMPCNNVDTPNLEAVRIMCVSQ